VHSNAAVRAQNVDQLAQGFLHSAALAADDFAAMLTRGNGMLPHPGAARTAVSYRFHGK
jgi:hypothetical protein